MMGNDDAHCITGDSRKPFLKLVLLVSADRSVGPVALEAHPARRLKTGNGNAVDVKEGFEVLRDVLSIVTVWIEEALPSLAPARHDFPELRRRGF